MVKSLSPGAVRTEIFGEAMLDVLKDRMLNPEDISAGVLYLLSTPPHVQVNKKLFISLILYINIYAICLIYRYMN